MAKKNRQANKIAIRKRAEELRKTTERLQKVVKESDLKDQELADLQDEIASNKAELATIAMDVDLDDPAAEGASQVQANTDEGGPEEPRETEVQNKSEELSRTEGVEDGKKGEKAAEQRDQPPVKEEPDTDGLFVPATSTIAQDAPGRSASKPVEIDALVVPLETLLLDREDDLITRENSAGSIQDKNFELLRTRKVGLGVQLLLRYGPPNASLYKWMQSNIWPDYPANTPDIMVDRLGEEKNPKTGKYRYGFNSVVSLQGVAIYYDPNKPENRNCEWWETLDPVFQEARKKEKEGLGHTKARLCYPNTYIKVKWLLDGSTRYSWETRTTVRRLWGKNNNRLADQDIYKAARINQSRYDQVQRGSRPALDRSASPGESVTAPRNYDSPGRGLTPQIAEAAPQIDKSALRAMYCELTGIDGNDLDENDEAKLEKYEQMFFP